LTRFFDTSALLNGAHEILIEPNPFLISIITLRELEDIKSSSKKDQDVKYKARQVLLYLYTNPAAYIVVDHTVTDAALVAQDLPLTNDNRIMMDASLYETANSLKVMFYTSDLSCHFLALNQFRLASKLFTPHSSTTHYEGYLRVSITDNELADFYTKVPEEESPKTKNQYNLLINEYIILENMYGSVVDMYRWNGKEHKPLDYQTIKTPYMGTIMPANLEQKLAFDLMQNRDIKIKILTGKYGTGEIFACIL
jgi:predicted ribonuclease YlaK